MTIIYMVEDLFKNKELEKKKAVVVDHYSRAYEKELRIRGLHINFDTLSECQINELYKNVKKLNDTAFVYKKV